MRFLHIVKKSAAREAGLKKYASAKLCPSGHFSERRVADGGCIDCKTQYYADNKDRILEYFKSKRQENLEKARADDNERSRIRMLSEDYSKAKIKRGRDYYQANRESIREKQNKKVAENREAKRELDRDYYVNNQKTIRAKQKVYREANPEIKRALHQKRRAIKSGAEGKFTADEISVLLEKQRRMCALCACKLKKSGENKFHMDHIQPLSKGGTNWISNIQLTCPGCNLKKNAKDPFEFAKQNGKLL